MRNNEGAPAIARCDAKSNKPLSLRSPSLSRLPPRARTSHALPYLVSLPRTRVPRPENSVLLLPSIHDAVQHDRQP